MHMDTDMRSRSCDLPVLQEVHVRWSRALLVASVLLFSYGLPLSLLGVDQWVSQRILQIVIVVSFIIHLVGAVYGRASNPTYHWMTALVGYMLFVTALYNTAIQPSPLFHWLPGIATFTPLLVFSLFDNFRVRIGEVGLGFLITAIFCALLTAVDQVLQLPSLDVYTRTAYFDTGLRRLVLAKTEQAFAFLLLLSIAFHFSRPTVRWIAIASLLLVGYSVFVVTESRLVVAALLIGTSIYLAFIMRAKRRLSALFLLLGVGLLTLPTLLNKYVAYIGSTDILREDVSVQFRLLERDFFESYFNETGGLGFGAMYINERLNNILSFAMFSAGAFFDAPGYPVSVGDIGFYGALYQFGYLGLLFSIALTLSSVLILLRAGRDPTDPHSNTLGVFGAIFLGFLISPLPMNFFTLDWTVAIGGTLWYLVSQTRQRYRH